MIKVYQTSVFETPAQTIINTVNCVGVMGKGLAAACSDRWPAMFDAYRQRCLNGELKPGKLLLYKTDTVWILNFPTKINWKYPSKIEWIEAGLQSFVRNYERMGITSINIPPLGCANGGLDWVTEVEPLIRQYLEPLSNIEINLCINNVRR